MINRKIAPQYNVPKDISFQYPEKQILPNNINLYIINAGKQDVMRFVLLFEAGTRYQLQSFVAAATLNTLNEGTKSHQAAEIAELFDFYGASFEVNIDRDWAMLSVYCLTKYAAPVLQLLEELIKTPVFPQEKIDIYKDRHKQALKMEEEKVAFLARREFLVSVYGADHPYGSYGQVQDYNDITPDLLSSFHSNNFSSENVTLFLSGKVSDTEIKLVEQHFGTGSWGKNQQTDRWFEPAYKQINNQFIHKDNALQSAIKYGKILFTKNHPDFIGMQVLNTVLGGYFGSRLMQNIREDKGYTYGIYSVMVPLQNSGYFSISTETGAEYTKAVISEINYEIERIQNELISNDELNLVKHYIFGEMLRTLDGPWVQTEVCIDAVQANLPANYVKSVFTEVRDIKAERLQHLAQQYLTPDTMHLVIAGKQ